MTRQKHFEKKISPLRIYLPGRESSARKAISSNASLTPLIIWTDHTKWQHIRNALLWREIPLSLLAVREMGGCPYRWSPSNCKWWNIICSLVRSGWILGISSGKSVRQVGEQKLLNFIGTKLMRFELNCHWIGDSIIHIHLYIYACYIILIKNQIYSLFNKKIYIW